MCEGRAFTEISALRFIRSANSVRESKFVAAFAILAALAFLGFMEELSFPCFANGELILDGLGVYDVFV